ncbi:hypothetical protein KEM56_005328 [Ascosphaera pollenicola]|nr:hypothetical protein KEM56_005328 [Ascosphaera pollenicola]
MSRAITRLSWRSLAPRAPTRALLTPNRFQLRPAVRTSYQARYQTAQAQAGPASTPVQSTPSTPKLISLKVNGKDEIFSPIHLRDACSCEWCVDTNTRQKEFDTAEIPPSLRASSVTVNKTDGSAEIVWENDLDRPHGYGNGGKHVSRYTQEQLVKLTKPYSPKGDANIDFRYYWNAAIMEKKQPWYNFNEYINSRTTLFDFVRSLHRYGVAFISNIPEDPASINRLANRLGPIRNTFYGETWDVRSVPKAVNVAYTNKFLGFHMDLMYMREAPEYQLLHCMKNSCNGGESLFADTFAAAWKLYLTQPDLFWHLVDFPVRFGYDNHGHIYDYVRTTIELVPGAEKKRGSKDGLKIGDIRYVNYSPPFQQPFYRYAADDSQATKFHADLDTYNVAVHEFATILNDPSMIFQLKLRPGDCAVFHNRRAVHARNAFDLSAPQGQEQQKSTTPAERWLRGTYVDGDPVASIMRVSQREEGEKWQSNGELPVAETWTREKGDPVEEGLRRLT